MDQPVSAGDVGRFAYCPLNWKLSRAGHEGRESRAGILKHAEVAERVDALETYQQHQRVTQETALYMGLAAASAAAIAVEVFALNRSNPGWWGLLFLSVVWMAASLYLVVFNLYYKDRARSVARSTKLAPGEVVFSDTARHPEVLESRVLPLRGRPDYVVEREGGFVPVELKTGATPKQPYDSHVLQLAAYCYLVHERYGRRPSVGVLAYPEREFTVPYTEELENRLVRTLLRIQLAKHAGDVHRDHTNPRRCLGCSRRDACPERLA